MAISCHVPALYGKWVEDVCVGQFRVLLLLLVLLFLNLGRSSRGGRQKLILEIIALMVNHPSGSHQQSSRAAG